jgi:hypothetical protein
MRRGNRNFHVFLCASAVCSLLNLSCSSLVSIIPLPYVPIVTFTGIVNTDSLYYPGNRQYPNSCRIKGDCVRMYLYSEDFSQGPISQGDQMRIDVYALDSQFITERHALFDLTRYSRGTTSPTYTIVPADTLNDFNNFHAKIESFERRHGGAILLKEMTVSARPLGQYASEPLTIVRGVITGSIE